MSSYERVLAASSRVLAASLEPAYYFRSNFCRFRSKLALALGWPFEFVFALDHELFLRNDEYGQEVKISSKCPTSAIDSPHVKYVKGCKAKSTCLTNKAKARVGLEYPSRTLQVGGSLLF